MIGLYTFFSIIRLDSPIIFLCTDTLYNIYATKLERQQALKYLTTSFSKDHTYNYLYGQNIGPENVSHFDLCYSNRSCRFSFVHGYSLLYATRMAK